MTANVHGGGFKCNCEAAYASRRERGLLEQGDTKYAHTATTAPDAAVGCQAYKYNQARQQFSCPQLGCQLVFAEVLVLLQDTRNLQSSSAVQSMVSRLIKLLVRHTYKYKHNQNTTSPCEAHTREQATVRTFLQGQV